MSNLSKPRVNTPLRVLTGIAITALTLFAVHKPLKAAFDQFAQLLDQFVGWDKLPKPLAILVLIGLRDILREKNLHDTSQLATPAPQPPAPSDEGYLTARTADGTYNDLTNPAMGSAGYRFGRNVPIEDTYPDNDWAILQPNPRTVSRELLTRDTFQPATTLNMMAAAWLQFMVRDWFSHGKGPNDDLWKLPQVGGDSWPEDAVTIPRLPTDPTRRPDVDHGPPTYLNTESHWWDASQIYGSSEQVQQAVRSGVDGKLKTHADGSLPFDQPPLVQAVNDPGWWLGLTLMYTLFVNEHNAICDYLKGHYPGWSDDQLFNHARLVNAALLAKIHTVEWTPAIIAHPTTKYAMHANWWGLLGEMVKRKVGRFGTGDVFSGIPGSTTNHHGVPYTLTEEFTAVYRMHPLIPDNYSLRSSRDDKLIQERGFREITNQRAQELTSEVSIEDLLYSFGTSHPGAITLHNYPRFLQEFERPDGHIQDLASTDVLRIRELGVPRYTEFRRLLHLRPVRSFEQLTDNREWADQLRQVYDNELDQVDLMVGMFAEPKPQGFGFSDTAFRVFILMASRRLKSDRFFTVGYTPDVYTREGLDWIDQNTMSTVLQRHFPRLDSSLRGIENAFTPWTKAR